MSAIKNSGVQLGDVVTIDYRAKLNNGSTVLTSRVDGPLTFTVGDYKDIAGFNQALLGMQVGEVKKCVLSHLDAFGAINQKLIIKSALADLPANITLGDKLENTRKNLIFTIIDINSQKATATLDANHMLAGQTLKFSITLLSNRKG